jgi:hypothetical protein
VALTHEYFFWRFYGCRASFSFLFIFLTFSSHFPQLSVLPISISQTFLHNILRICLRHTCKSFFSALFNDALNCWGYLASAIDGWINLEHWWNDTDRGKPSTRWQICPSATLSTTKPTWTGLGLNLGLRGERRAINRLSHGTALLLSLSYLQRSNSSVKSKN